MIFDKKKRMKIDKAFMDILESGCPKKDDYQNWDMEFD